MKTNAVKKHLATFVKRNLPRCLYGMYVCYKYQKVMGKKCNLNNPKTYTEKVQWCKIHRRDPLLTRLSDKIEVRPWVEDKIGAEYLIPTIGEVFNSADEMELDSLPDRFVIKANHGSGTNLIINDKKEITYDKIRKIANGWLNENFAFNSFELQYKDIQPRLYIEQNLLAEGMRDLPDYKFFCFNGKVFCLYVMVDGHPVHKNARLGIFDRDFKLLPYYRADFNRITEQLERPRNYDEMVKVAEKLAEGFSHVRVDLYNIDGKIYFGEMTFSTGSGLFKHVPEEFDEILGNQWDLNLGI